MTEKNIFVLGLDDAGRRQLAAIRGAETMSFRALADAREVVGVGRYRVRELLTGALTELRRTAGRIDAVIGYHDFPVSTLLPILRRELGQPGPELEAVLRCEHKYWSRIVQGEVSPESTPRFAAFDPFDDAALLRVGLRYPFWIKPVKSFSSYLGFRVRSSQEFCAAIRGIRAGIGRFRDAFGRVLAEADLPPAIAAAGGGYCVAEESIDADHQATVEGYVHGDRVVCYGFVDSIRRSGESSFMAYEYPSSLPRGVKERMEAISERVMSHLGYREGPFNIEYFWDERSDRISLLEINPRISKSHAPLFELVEGAPHHEVAVDLALGRAPRFPPGGGRYRYAGKYFLRVYEDAVVRSGPTTDDLERFHGACPGAEVEIHARPGRPLSELSDQDSYSFVLGVAYIGADSLEDLRARYRLAEALLPFELVGRTPSPPAPTPRAYRR